MSSRTFSVRVPGKWVLAGEHSVLRGKPALALPHPTDALTLHFTPAESSLDRAIGFEVQSEIPGLSAWLESLGWELPHGILRVESTIPVGAGLGSSAALSVALARFHAWIEKREAQTPEPTISNEARSLENHFHGTSSGMDIAAVMARGPILFQRVTSPTAEAPFRVQITPLGAFELPVTFHDTGLRSSTRAAVAQVEAFGAREPRAQAALDDQMEQAVLKGQEGALALARGDSRGLLNLREAFELSMECYRIWGLLPPEVVAQARHLVAQGALAARLTGAGSGGMLVALWPKSR